MPLYVLSAFGRNRPGIVAGVAGVLLRHGANVQDSQMAILRGRFAMMLVVDAPDDADDEALNADLRDAAQELELESLLVSALGHDGPPPGPVAFPTHVVTVYGADHPGILHAATAALAGLGVDITDLHTRLVGEDAEPVYALLMEVVLPPDATSGDLSAALEEVGRAQGVDVSVRPLEHEAL